MDLIVGRYLVSEPMSRERKPLTMHLFPEKLIIWSGRLTAVLIRTR